MKTILMVALLLVMALYMLTLIGAPFYFKFGWFKRFYHDVMQWHVPGNDDILWFDGCSRHSICKYCGNEIMQDSQGNWF